MTAKKFWFSCTLTLLSGCVGARPAEPPRSGNPGEPVERQETVLTAVKGRPAAAGPSQVAESGDPDERAIGELRRASQLFETFIAKAGSDPRFADAVVRSRARIEDIQGTLLFLEEGLRERNAR